MWWSPYCDKMIIIVASSSQNLSFTIQNPILLDVIFSSFPVASGWKTLQNQDRGICTFFFLCSVCNAIIRFGWRFIFLCIWPPGVWAGKPILRCCNIFVEQSKDTIIGSEILSKLYQGLCDLEISIFFIFIGPRFDPCPPLTHWLGQSLLSFRLDWCDPGFDAFFSETSDCKGATSHFYAYDKIPSFYWDFRGVVKKTDNLRPGWP